MKENSDNKFVSVRSIPPTYKRLFKREVNLYDAIEHAYWCLKKIGNLHMKDKLLRAKVKNRVIQVPCDMTKILAVASSNPLTNFYTNIDPNAGYVILLNGFDPKDTGAVQPGPTNITPAQTVLDLMVPYYLNDVQEVIKGYRGRFIDYIWEGQFLRFNCDNVEVDIIYQGIYIDKDEFMMVDEECLLAICYYINYLELSAGMMNNEKVSQISLQIAEKEKERHIGQARASGGWSANAGDKIFDALASHNRKKFGVQLMGL
jgi:hypothetical protein